VELGEPDVSPVQIQGPKSKPLVRKLFGDEVADPGHGPPAARLATDKLSTAGRILRVNL